MNNGTIGVPWLCGLLTATSLAVSTTLWCCFTAQETNADDVVGTRATESDPIEAAPTQPAKLPAPYGAKRLDPKYDIWLDSKHKQVIIDGEICFRRGLLEMFACTRATKEHESVVTLDTKAYLAHAALLALGAKKGGPALFHPEYKPAHGTEIEVTIEWKDGGGKNHRARAQDWVRNIATKKKLASPWVFAGSRFWTDESTGREHYSAESGDFICVSNFPSATLDLNVKSSQMNDQLLFEAFTERIPPLGTPVRVILTPKLTDRKPKAKKPSKTEPTAQDDADESDKSSSE